MGSVNFVLVSSGPHTGKYDNLAPLLDRVASTANVSRRTFTRRIGALRHELHLSIHDLLILTGGELLGLLQPEDTRLPFEAFVERIEGHCRKFTARPVPSVTTTGDAPAYDYAQEYVRYPNNRSSIRFECLADSSHPRYEKPFGRLDSQGCPACGDKHGRDKRRLARDELARRVASHHLGLEIVGGLEGVRNNTSFLTLRRRECGHTIACAVQDLTAPRRLRVCPGCHPVRVGEAITAVVATYLLTGSRDPSPYCESPQILSRADDPTDQRTLRLDVFFEDCLPGIHFIVEHHGHHHYEATRYGGRSKDDAREAFRLQQDRDAWLRAVVEASAGRLKLAEVPDLLTNTEDLLAAVSFVVELIIKELPSVFQLSGLADRRTKLQDVAFVTELMHDAAVIRAPVERLRRELAKEQAEIEVRGFDPISGCFHLHCRKCNHRWSPRANNAFSSKQTERNGTRCPTCADQSRGLKRRKPYLIVIAEARPHGLSPDFSEKDYKGVGIPVAWTCDVCGQTVMRSVNQLRRGRGCKHDRE